MAKAHPKRAHKHRVGGRMVSCRKRGAGKRRTRKQKRNVLGMYKR